MLNNDSKQGGSGGKERADRVLYWLVPPRSGRALRRKEAVVKGVDGSVPATGQQEPTEPEGKSHKND